MFFISSQAEKMTLRPACAVAWQMPPGRQSVSMGFFCWRRGPDINFKGLTTADHRRLGQTTHHSHPSCYASVGLEATVTGGGGCPDPLLRPEYPSHRCTAPAERRVSLVSGHSTRNTVPRPMHRFVRFNSGLASFCSCRAQTTYAPEASRSGSTPSAPISGVW